MKRLLALVIAMLLPLQLAWGMAASYCPHEPVTAGGAHFGHHSHVHGDAQQGHQPEAKKPGLAAAQGDLDCSGCHASTPAVLPEPSAQPAHHEAARHRLSRRDDRYPSVPQRAPDRPQWPRLA